MTIDEINAVISLATIDHLKTYFKSQEERIDCLTEAIVAMQKEIDALVTITKVMANDLYTK